MPGRTVDDQRFSESVAEVVVCVVLVLLLLAMLSGCAALEDLAHTPVSQEPGAATVGEVAVEGVSAGLAVANPLTGVAALLGGRLLLGVLRRR